ncbi:MAG: hypothetical protein LQ352_000316 [Teloschistes flavicans]|nr:MAG: hypothetical protein LQ352_000316 [Teloschistes flavicans]
MSMAPHETSTEETGGSADLAKAFEELAKYVIHLFEDSILPLLVLILDLVFRGEKAASAMENQLTALEQKIDALLEDAEARIDSALEGTGPGSKAEGGDKKNAEGADQAQ